MMMQLRAVRTLTGCTNAQPISAFIVCVSPIPMCHPSYFYVGKCKLCTRAVGVLPSLRVCAGSSESLPIAVLSRISCLPVFGRGHINCKTA